MWLKSFLDNLYVCKLFHQITSFVTCHALLLVVIDQLFASYHIGPILTKWKTTRNTNTTSGRRHHLRLINKIRKLLYSLILYKVTKTTPVRRDHMRPGPGPVRRTKVNRPTFQSALRPAPGMSPIIVFSPESAKNLLI